MNSVNADVEKLIQYNWDTECDSYSEENNLGEGDDPVEHALANTESNHIFCVLARLHVSTPVKPAIALMDEDPDYMIQAILDILKGTPIMYHGIESNYPVEIRFKGHESFLDTVEFLEQEENWVCWSEVEDVLMVALKQGQPGCPCCGYMEVKVRGSYSTYGEIQTDGKIKFYQQETEDDKVTCERCGYEITDYEEVKDDKQTA